eukprot:1099127-Rhodomonas_salina.1
MQEAGRGKKGKGGAGSAAMALAAGAAGTSPPVLGAGESDDERPGLTSPPRARHHVIPHVVCTCVAV